MSSAQLKDMTDEAAKVLGKPQIKSDGCFTFEYFLKSQALINTHWQKYACTIMEERDVHRRSLYAKENGDELVSTEVVRSQKWEQHSQ